MRRVLIFGGTTEGRELFSFCEEEKIPAVVSVATAYGREVLPQGSYVSVHTGRLSEEAMEDYIRENRFSLVIDATHPYAREASKQIAAVSDRLAIPRLRVVRERGAEEFGRYFDTLSELVAALNEEDGNVLVTTGSKQAAVFCAVRNYKERIYLRVLNDTGVINQCIADGFLRSHILTGRGPFDVAANKRHLTEANARILVSKDGGPEGGFPEKVQAVKELGVLLFVLRRPAEEGISLSEIKGILKNDKTD